MENGSKTRKGDRQIVSVSLPLPVYDALQEIAEHYSMNRSALIAKAIADYLKALGLKVGEK
ncbi:MAG: ribbon-helix-helix protein, CopG family [Clostridiales bacterium]|nr:ribbon-helix-helix protein, CopG family [Clostridiales bacterium]